MMTLPLPVRNRLAALILEAFDDATARQTLEALGASCRDAGGCLDAGVEARLRGLGWFRASAAGDLHPLGVTQVYLPELCRRAMAAVAMFEDHPTMASGATLSGLLTRAACLAARALFFEVHELLEPAWMRAAAGERLALQALIQVAVAFHHAEKGNRAGAILLLSDGLAGLAASGSALPLDTGPRQGALSGILAALREGRRLPPAAWPAPISVVPVAQHLD